MNKQTIKMGLIATSVLVPMSATISNADTIQQSSVEYRTITANSVNFRKGPSTSYDSMGKFYNGDKVEYISKSGEWVNVKHNGTVGYVHGDYVSTSSGEDTSDNTVKYNKVVSASSLNFRKGPGTSYSKLGSISYGTKVGVISESNGWAKINYNGQIGYVSSQYLKDSGEVDPGGDTTIKYNKVVSASSLNFRKGPGTSYSKLGSISYGTKVGVISESNGWAKISYNGQIGYVSSQYLKDSGEVDPGEDTVKYNRKVSASSLNFRKGPGTSYSKIGSISYGTEVGVISESNGWAKIKYNGQVGYVSSQYLAENIDEGGGSPSQSADKLIDYAKTLLGKPYVWGAEGPNSFDCSGFTQYVFRNSAGVSIPRVSRDQAKHGQYVSKSNLQKGDLIFFDTSGANDGNVSHVGIYMGNNQMIHASSGKGKVVISELSSYYQNAYVNARRVL